MSLLACYLAEVSARELWAACTSGVTASQGQQAAPERHTEKHARPFCPPAVPSPMPAPTSQMAVCATLQESQARLTFRNFTMVGAPAPVSSTPRAAKKERKLECRLRSSGRESCITLVPRLYFASSRRQNGLSDRQAPCARSLTRPGGAAKVGGDCCASLCSQAAFRWSLDVHSAAGRQWLCSTAKVLQGIHRRCAKVLEC